MIRDSSSRNSSPQLFWLLQAHTLTCTWTHRHIHSRAYSLKCIFSERKKWDMNIYVLEKVNITFCKCDLSTDQFILYSVLSGFCLCISQSDHMLSILIMLNFIRVRMVLNILWWKKDPKAKYLWKITEESVFIYRLEHAIALWLRSAKKFFKNTQNLKIQIYFFFMYAL